jgi:hypothetical protein
VVELINILRQKPSDLHSSLQIYRRCSAGLKPAPAADNAYFPRDILVPCGNRALLRGVTRRKKIRYYVRHPVDDLLVAWERRLTAVRKDQAYLRPQRRMHLEGGGGPVERAPNIRGIIESRLRGLGLGPRLSFRRPQGKSRWCSGCRLSRLSLLICEPLGNEEILSQIGDSVFDLRVPR